MTDSMDIPPLPAGPSAAPTKAQIKAAQPAEVQSARQQAEVAGQIVWMLGGLGAMGIVAAVVAAGLLINMAGAKITPPEAAMLAVGGIVTAGIGLATTVVGALANSLNAPSGMASVLAQAKKVPDQ